MGSKCSCLSTPPESRQLFNTESMKETVNSIRSPVTSENRRFSLPASPLRLSEVFKTTTTKYQHIELIDSKEMDDFDLTDNINNNNNKLDINPLHDIHETINYLISGYLRHNINIINDLTLFSIIKKICYQYCNYYLLFNPSPNNNINDKHNDNFSIIINTLTD
eukprot:470647_1